METFELRYFLGVAADQNIHHASRKLHTSPATLSKAIQRLERELGVKLFLREGRNIRLSKEGQLLQRKASEIVHLEETARLAVSGYRGTVHAVFAAPEVLLGRFASSLCKDIKKRFPAATFEYQIATEQECLEKIKKGEAHLGFVSSKVPPGFFVRPLQDSVFQTCVGRGHPLYSLALNKKTVAVEKVLEHGFASPDRALLGTMGTKQSLDGWRDDKFPRRVEHLVSSVKLLEDLVVNGLAVAYFPDYLVESIDVLPLKISGCPYSCKQKIQLVARDLNEVGWLRQDLFFAH
jgi:LysR family transcriptional activator of glutamate synthase operon